MIPLVDMHCHLFAAIDDGPRSDEESLAMCRLAYADGIHVASATAHQNERWSAVTPERIRVAARRLSQLLRDAGVPLAIFPCAEVMAHPEMEASWRKGALLSIADRGQYLLLEMPHGIVVELADSARRLVQAGVRPILAHPERHEELLHEAGRIEELIQAGCLVQVSSGNITAPKSGRDARQLKSWFQRGVVHFIGSDAHSPNSRPPQMAQAYHQIARWASTRVADRVCSTNGLAVINGFPMRISPPELRSTRWVPKFW